jgi:hypothetical protein
VYCCGAKRSQQLHRWLNKPASFKRRTISHLWHLYLGRYSRSGECRRIFGPPCIDPRGGTERRGIAPRLLFGAWPRRNQPWSRMQRHWKPHLADEDKRGASTGHQVFAMVGFHAAMEVDACGAVAAGGPRLPYARARWKQNRIAAPHRGHLWQEETGAATGVEPKSTARPE